MNNGGALLVQVNNLHGASRCGPCVEAYAWTPTMHAACTWELSEVSDNLDLHWRHYIDDRFSIRNSFTAALSAWCLRWNCIKDAFHDAFIQVSSVCSIDSSTVHLFDSNIDRRNDQPQIANVFMQNDSVAAYPVSTVDLLHVDALPKVYCHSYQKMPYSNGLSNHISSCISKSRKGASRERRVQFESTVLLHIGLEDELVMGTVEISSEDLATWNEKPWTKKSKKIKSRKYQDSSCMHPSKFFDVSSNGDTGLAQHPDGQMGRRHSSSSHCNQGFASHLALTMSRAELSNEDEFSLMQTRLPAGIAFKNAAEDYQNVDIVQAFQEGQMFQQDDPTGSERDHHEDSEGYSPGDGSDFSGHILLPMMKIDRMSCSITWMTAPLEPWSAGTAMKT